VRVCAGVGGVFLCRCVLCAFDLSLIVLHFQYVHVHYIEPLIHKERRRGLCGVLCAHRRP